MPDSEKARGRPQQLVVRASTLIRGLVSRLTPRPNTALNTAMAKVKADRGRARKSSATPPLARVRPRSALAYHPRLQCCRFKLVARP